MTPAEIRDDAWSLLLDYAAETGTLANECEHAGIDAEEVARLREKSAKIRAAAAALAGMCVLEVEVVRALVKATRSEMEMMDAIDRHHVEPEDQRSAGAYADRLDADLDAAEAEVARVEGR